MTGHWINAGTESTTIKMNSAVLCLRPVADPQTAAGLAQVAFFVLDMLKVTDRVSLNILLCFWLTKMLHLPRLAASLSVAYSRTWRCCRGSSVSWLQRALLQSSKSPGNKCTAWKMLFDYLPTQSSGSSKLWAKGRALWQRSLQKHKSSAEAKNAELGNVFHELVPDGESIPIVDVGGRVEAVFNMVEHFLCLEEASQGFLYGVSS